MMAMISSGRPQNSGLGSQVPFVVGLSLAGSWLTFPARMTPALSPSNLPSRANLGIEAG